MVHLAPLVDVISIERVRDELTRMLTGENPARALHLLDEAWMLRRVLPEVAAMKGVEQGRDYHPEGDVFIHTLLVLEKLEPRTDVTAWAALLHDVGKPRTFEKTGEKITFYQHEKVGAAMALEICRRLRFSHAFAERVSVLVSRHMRFMTAREWRTSTMRRFLAAETIEEDLAVHRADCLASHGDLSAWVLVGEKLAEARRDSGGEALPPPLVTGEDLIALGLAPGPRFKVLLEKAREWQLEGEVAGREEALARLAGLLAEDELRQGR
jgi:putative nucleotidyltransferase with HDIG domain